MRVDGAVILLPIWDSVEWSGSKVDALALEHVTNYDIPLVLEMMRDMDDRIE